MNSFEDHKKELQKFLKGGENYINNDELHQEGGVYSNEYDTKSLIKIGIYEEIKRLEMLCQEVEHEGEDDLTRWTEREQ